MTEHIQTEKQLPIGGAGSNSNGWWGLWALIVTEASLFGYLLLIYFYQAMHQSSQWPPDGVPALSLPSINTLILLSSSGLVWWAERCVKRNRVRLSLVPLAAAILAGIIFVGVQLKEWHGKSFDVHTHLY